MMRLLFKFTLSVSMVFCFLAFHLPPAAVQAAPIQAPHAVGAWWDDQWDYRVPITIGTNGFARTNKPVEVSLNFTQLLTTLGSSGAFDPNSIRVIEVDSNGNVVVANVPFQFDQAADYNATTNASGALVFIMAGNTLATATRYFHVYFDLTGKGFTLPTFTPQVTLTDNIMDEGQSSFRVQTQNGTYFYQKQGAAFSSLLDTANNDWISYNVTVGPGGAGGSYRGIPNMIYPEGKFHPGNTESTSTIVAQGPLKATIHSVTNDNKWEAIWEIFPTYARMTVLKKDHNYWFLYEGTPGGALDTTNDIVMRANGTETAASASWDGDLSGFEWVYFGDKALGSSLFVANHADDSAVDSYFPLSDASGSMTVFGFGRQNTNSFLTATPARFTIGLLSTTQLATATPTINSAYIDLNVQVGQPDGNINIPPTITKLACISGPTYVTIAWETSQSTTGVVNYGPTAAYGNSQNDNVLKRTHAVKILGLNPANPVHFQIAATSIGNLTVTSSDNTCSALGASSIQSDDFNQCALNTNLWTYIDPQSGANATPLRATGTDLELAVPGGASHDIWRSGILAPRIMQAANNNDFTVEVKFNSGISQTYQMQGLLVQQDQDDLLRVNVQYDTGQIHLLAIQFVAGEPTIVIQRILPNGNAPIYLRILREGITWQLFYSYDGGTWLTDAGYRFDYILNVSSIGVFAGNAGAPPPAHTALIDYFFNTASPITPEDAVGRILGPIAISPAGKGTASSQPVTPTPGNPGCGSPMQLTANPIPGWSLDHWSSKNGSVTGQENPKVTTFSTGEVVTATFQQDQYTLTTNIVGGGAVSRSPVKATYIYSDVVTLTATPDTDWFFVGWSGAITGSNLTQNVQITGNTQVTATFAQHQYTVQTNVTGQGQVSINPSKAQYAQGENITITAQPAAGWQFAGWQGDVTDNTNPLTLPVTQDLSITALFTPIPYTLTTQVMGQGQLHVTPNQATYHYGDVVTLNAQPAAGWQFSHWEGGVTGTAASQTLTVTQSIAVTAVFTNSGYTVITATVGSGAIVLTPAKNSYLRDEVVTATAVPAPGWTFAGWSGSLSGLVNPTVLLIDNSKTVTATFQQLTYTLTIAVVGESGAQGGHVTVDPAGPYLYGQTVTLTAIPDQGYTFAGWDVGATAAQETKDRLPDPTIQVEVTGNEQYTANFAIAQKLYLPIISSARTAN